MKILYKKEDGTLIKEFKSVLAASKELNLSSGYISIRCTGRKKQSDGVIFEYKNKEIDKISFFGKSIKKHKTLFSVSSLKNKTQKFNLSNILIRIDNHHTVYFIIQKKYKYRKTFPEFKSLDLIQELKECGAYKFLGSPKTGEGYIDKYIWLTICHSIAPELYKNTKTQISFKSILNRIESKYIPTGILTAMESIDKVDFLQLKTALNYILFDSGDITNKLTKSSLNKLKSIEANILYIIKKGYILSFQDLINELREIYSLKNK